MDSQYEIERKLVYSVIVAGKSAKFAEQAVTRFLSSVFSEETPFQYIDRLVTEGTLNAHLRASRCGNYTKTWKCLARVIKLDLWTCTVTDLESIHGIGPKTARFFLLWTRPGIRVAALDTHILKWLCRVRPDLKVPKSTPPAGQKYNELEQAFLQEADDMKLTPRELDYRVWTEYSGYEETSKQAEFAEQGLVQKHET